MVWYGMVDTWPPKRPGPASDRDNVTRQTLRAGIRAPPPEKPYVRNIIGGTRFGPRLTHTAEYPSVSQQTALERGVRS